MILYLLLIFISATSSAQNPECDPQISTLGSETELVSCATESIKEGLSTNPGDIKQACHCAEAFKKTSKVLGLNVKQDTSFLKNKLLGELKKALTENINYIAKLRVLPIKADYPQAVQACNLDSMVQACGSDPDLAQFRDSIRNEIALLISPTGELNNEGTVDREVSENSCSISDSSILQAQSLILDDEISEDLITKMKTADLSSTEKIMTFLDKAKTETHLLNLFKSHPILGPLLQKPAEFKNFFTNLKSPVAANFKKNLYENPLIAQGIDQQIANSCNKAMNAYKNIACGASGKPNKIKLSSLKGLEPLINSEGFKIDDESIDLLNPNPKTLKTTEELVELCSNLSNDKNALDVRPFYDNLRDLIDPKFQKLSYEEYRKNKYDKDFNSVRQNICPQLSPMCTTDEYTCRLAKLIKDPKNQLLATSTDPGMQKLLRSFVGDKPSLSTSSATRDILIAQGIWPKSDGSYVAQKSAPERKSNFFTELASAATESNVPVQANVGTQAQADRRASGARQQGQNTLPASYTNQNSATFAQTSTNTTSAPREMDQADLDELRRKVEDLKNSPTPSKTQQADSTQPTAPTRLAQNNSLRTALASNFAQGVPEQATPAAVATSAPSLAPSTQDNRDTRDPQQLAAQASQARMNQALAGMAGARSGSSSTTDSSPSNSLKGQDSKDRSPASEAESHGALITKVLDPSQLQNLNSLAQQKKDFVFQINTSTFKISFNQATGTYGAQLTSSRTEDSEALKENLLQYLNQRAIKSGRLNSLQEALKN